MFHGENTMMKEDYDQIIDAFSLCYQPPDREVHWEEYSNKTVKDLLIDMSMSVVLAEGIVNESPSAIIENSKEGFPFLPCNLN
tara:strand:+ start:2270 stop:2518 length:249 start_codon:yes stop_codon:yes gene_type:complete